MAKEKEKEKSEPAEEIELTDEEEVFAMYGIEDDNAQRRVREMAAGRTLHLRKSTPKKKKKEDDDPWGSSGGRD